MTVTFDESEMGDVAHQVLYNGTFMAAPLSVYATGEWISNNRHRKKTK